MAVAGGGKGAAAELRAAAEEAIESIGLGYDLTVDLRLKYGKKKGGKLIIIDYDKKVRDIVVPGGILVRDVPKSIICDKGERLRFSSDVLPFQHMSEQFNQELSLSGKIPAGHFNTAFEFSSSWQKDAANTKTLAFDGVSITLYSIMLQKTQLALGDYVRKFVPSSWDPAALARFIEKFGTHVIVGVKMGGKDIVYVKELYSSTLEPADVQKRLKEVADKRFTQGTEHLKRDSKQDPGMPFMDVSTRSSHSLNEDIMFIWKRRGGNNRKNLPHDKWCQTVHLEPDVISMSFIPISSLLSGIDGSGFLSHAINLYLRYKPPIEELYQFLEFQYPKQWAPVFGELALGPDTKHQRNASLQFSFMGPRLYVNTNLVEVGNKPVTGIRLYLEGKRNNCLAIHLQHLSSLPKTFQLQTNLKPDPINLYDRRYYEKVKCKSFSHICTAPVESDEDLLIVTGAHFEVKTFGFKRVLLLRLIFSKVIGTTVVKKPEWDGSQALVQKSGIFSTLLSTPFSTALKPLPKPSDIHINSALYPGGPPVPAHAPKLLRFVDTSEMARGPQDMPGYWAVCGARLMVDKGKISLRVKYSLLTVILPDEEDPESS